MEPPPFLFHPLQFTFRAAGPIAFPPGKTGNVLRGVFGAVLKKTACVPHCPGVQICDLRATCSYARIFEPAAIAGAGPSGLADWPRPFVFRCRHLDGRRIPAGERFRVDMNLFGANEDAIPDITRAFARLAESGLGSDRAPAILEYEPPPPAVTLSLAPPAKAVHRIAIDFLTPTELKAGDALASQPEFAILFARIRDRVSTLMSLYDGGAPAIDFKAMGTRAAAVRMTQCEIRRIEAERLSRRTGQRHSLGGFVGSAVYEGDLTEFIPYLEVAAHTGVGRQTTWGKGEIAVRGF